MDPRAAASVLALFVAAAMSPAVVVVGDFAADRAECSDKLVGLATCLTYVQDEASAPTPDCCAGLKTVLQSSRKCLCVLVKDKDDPNLGLKLNVTKALGLPAVCNAPANISDCPRLLNLAPNSKEAQVFEQYAKQAAAQGTTPSATGQFHYQSICFNLFPVHFLCLASCLHDLVVACFDMASKITVSLAS
uniref:Bifunctional inhibitor/plant lipid transfer protein/seed storage helical domain-containing protein n=1 Tax=Setaria viridis TaxID=4556 RepID=A0A4U6VT37_SETVI|nr:hypothetical protein SEVIR_2G078200v2 [Setaria viridis]